CPLNDDLVLLLAKTCDSPADVLRMAMTCKSWHTLAMSDTVWKRICTHAGCLHLPVSITLVEPSFQAVYTTFRKTYGPFHALYTRCFHLAAQIQQFLKTRCPVIHDTMRYHCLSWSNIRRIGQTTHVNQTISTAWCRGRQELWMLQHLIDGQNVHPFQTAG